MVDFRSEPANVRDKINEWNRSELEISYQNELLPIDSVSVDTELVVANALTFCGKWNERYDIDGFSDFYLLDGSSCSALFMTSKERQWIGSYPGFKVLRLPYKQGKGQKCYAMYIFLPEEGDGLFELVERFANEPCFFNTHLPNKMVLVENFKIPISSLNVVTASMGIVWPPPLCALEDSAGSCSTYHLIDFCFDSAFFSCEDERQQRQKSADCVPTSSQLRACRPTRSNPVNFVADHPFMYVIREDLSGIVLITGRVSHPALDYK